MKTKRYEVTFQSADRRVWQVTVRADGISERYELLVFWRGFWRKTMHIIAKSALISVIEME